MRELTPEAQADRDDFSDEYRRSCCSCHLSPPCGYCLHPDNPDNQAECDECWIDVPEIIEHRIGVLSGIPIYTTSQLPMPGVQKIQLGAVCVSQQFRTDFDNWLLALFGKTKSIDAVELNGKMFVSARVFDEMIKQGRLHDVTAKS